jgi:hypothetical protein
MMVYDLFKRAVELIMLQSNSFESMRFDEPVTVEARNGDDPDGPQTGWMIYPEASIVCLHDQHWIFALGKSNFNLPDSNPLIDILIIRIHAGAAKERVASLIRHSANFRNSILIGLHGGSVQVNDNGCFRQECLEKIFSLTDARINDGIGSQKRHDPALAYDLSCKIISALSKEASRAA